MSPSLPPELVTDMLSRLPAKSIGQFRCVSKPWRSLLSDPQFIKAHLTCQGNHDPEKLILVSSSDHSLYTLTFTTDSRNDATSRNLSFPQCQDKWEKVVGSCHGLVVAVNDENSKFLINPTTLELVKVPNFTLALDPFASFSMYGFGYDNSSDDYKIVTLSYYDTDNEHEPDCAGTFVDVYSVKMRTWRRLESSPYDHAVPDLDSGVFLNGAIHWLASCTSTGYPSVIAAFDLACEQFKEVPAPSTLDVGRFVFNKLVLLGGCLGMVVDGLGDRIDVWVMKEYGVQASWTKFSFDAPEAWNLFRPICQLGDEEIVLEQDGEKLVVYNLIEETLRDMVVADILDSFEDGVMTFSESLVSPSFYSRYEEQHNPEGED